MDRLIQKCFVFLAAASVTVVCAVSGSAAVYMIGDADGDGAITSVDVATVQRVIAGVYSDDDGAIARRGNVTGGGLSLADATAIQRYLSGLSDRYQIGDTIGDDLPYLPTEDNQLPVIK